MPASPNRIAFGSNSITISASLYDYIEQVVDGIDGGAVRGRLEEEVEELAKRARNNWPVRTGRSRGAGSTGTRVTEGMASRLFGDARPVGKLQVWVRNDIPYAKYVMIRRKDIRDANRILARGDAPKITVKENRGVWTSLVSRRAKARAKALVKDLRWHLYALATGNPDV